MCMFEPGSVPPGPGAGIAFPTCVSLSNCVCHFSPLKSDPPLSLTTGDLLKV